MEKFESNKFRSKLSREFRKIEEFLQEFEGAFDAEMREIIFKNYSEIEDNDRLSEVVLTYANEIINVAESVCDKDLSYPENRLKEELDNMSRVLDNYPSENLNPEFLQQTHQKAKELMVNYYPYIFDLSPNGFRLLEKYCQMYNRKFVDVFQSNIKK